MKIFFRSPTLLALLIIATTVDLAAQSPASLDDFLGIKWGTPLADAKRSMLARPSMALDAKNSDGDFLVFTGGTFAGQQFEFIMLQFSAEGFHTARVYMKERVSARTLDRYATVKKLIEEKFGTTEADYRLFDSPWTDGDGMETTAIRSGKATIAAYWKFPVPGQEANNLSVKIDDDLYVVVTYQNSTMMQRVIDQSKQKTQQDW